MDYQVNKTSLHYDVVGPRQRGEDLVLLEHAIDLTSKTNWCKTGYTIEKLFDSTVYKNFQEATRILLIDLWRKGTLQIPENFQLDQYHKFANSKEKHLSAVEKTKLIDVKYFPVDIRILEKRILKSVYPIFAIKNLL
jgi:hypothetical protein